MYPFVDAHKLAASARVLQIWICILIIGLSTGASSPGPVGQCTVATMQAAAPAETTIVSAERLLVPVPHCKVEGYVTSTNPGPNRNNFRLQLPDQANWNHRFYFIGLGGAAGYVPTESQLPRGNPLVKGFAVAGTDKGHQGPALDWSFRNDPAKVLDNEHRGAHVTTVAAQQLTKAYYGADRMYRYHSGCSGGGDMGVQAMWRHPEDYDGVLLGWPGGHHPDPKKDGPIRNFEVMLREVMREPGAWVSPAKRAFAERKVLEACDISDGARDRMIWDHRQCRFDFRKLQCRAADGPNCLTKAEATTLTNIVRESAAPISDLTVWGSYLGDVPPPWNPSPAPENAAHTAMAYVIMNGWARTILNQPDRDILVDPLTSTEIETIARGQVSAPGQQVDLNAFSRSGGKAIFYVGVSDPCCSNLALEQFFRDINRTMGAAPVDRFAKLYQVPGWGHCGGGTGPTDGQDRMLQALMDWVEKGRAPKGIEMHRGADRAQLLFADAGSTTAGILIPQSQGSSRDFLVCPFPAKSAFDRSKAGVPGAVYDARNWSCRPPGGTR